MLYCICGNIFKRGKIPLAEAVERNDLIGPFVQGNSIRAELK